MENQIIVALLFSISNQTTIVNNASSAVAKKKITRYTVQHRNGERKISSGSSGLTNREPFERLRSAEDVKENQMSSLN